MINVSFDFDSTLDRDEVQELAQHLIEGGNNVWITTTRSGHKTDNSDILDVAHRIGIPMKHIRFTDHQNKAKFLFGFDFHFDDDPYEIEMIMSENNGCTGFLVPVKVKDNFKLPS